jgi:hypothetical protein
VRSVAHAAFSTNISWTHCSYWSANNHGVTDFILFEHEHGTEDGIDVRWVNMTGYLAEFRQTGRQVYEQTKTLGI